MTLLGILLDSIQFGAIFCLGLGILWKKKFINIGLIIIFLLFGYFAYSHIFLLTSLSHVHDHLTIGTPMIYRIGSIWSDHSGSLFLFLTMLAVAAYSVKNITVKSILAFNIIALYSYTFFMANPFVISTSSVLKDHAFNPALQHNLLAIHPPILYLGQILCSLAWAGSFYFPYGVLRKILQFSFFFLTLGIILGAFWAYGELGWGGYWFWDPVEILALLPWLMVAAAIHAKDNYSLMQFYSLLSYPMVVLSMILARSNLLTSVHSFANDNNHMIWLMAYGFIILLLTLAIWLNFKKKLQVKGRSYASLGFLALLIILFTSLMVMIFNINIHITENFYNQNLMPLIALGLGFASLAPVLKINRRKVFDFILAVTLTLLWQLMLQKYFGIRLNLAVIIGLWLIISTVKVSYFYKKPFAIAHMGVGIMLIFGTYTQKYSETENFPLHPNETIAFANHLITIKDHKSVKGPGFDGEMIHFQLDDFKRLLSPNRQFFNVNNIVKHQGDWRTFGFHQIHAVIYTNHDGHWCAEFLYKPLIVFFWFGCLILLYGLCLLAIADRFKIK